MEGTNFEGRPLFLISLIAFYFLFLGLFPAAVHLGFQLLSDRPHGFTLVSLTWTSPFVLSACG